MQLTLDRFGRMVLPRAIRDALGLGPGALLDVCEQGDCLVLRPVREEALVRKKDGVSVFTGAAEGNLREAVAEHRKERLRHAAGRRMRP
ncbi:MAG: hypothetical protein A3K19_16105 [Lentisphaerae bacterium RIFOXYB12_FULL_65_16]|nr:MAG: hypothetical protein A3K18_25855 [Lentisphaerae bacterium RIFOXYA12_64_32]OGV88866.1 MAG: hypothetical protein A3K19_16105 [Lentisphaerae bacterium RIFOXYB12_FULL_65_16]